MFPLPKRWKMVAAVGYGVIMSQALVGFVRFGYWLSGGSLSQEAGGRIFLVSSVLAGSLSAYLYARFAKSTATSATASLPPREAQ
jgi:hypothetical protein